MNQVIRVLVADDHAMVREGIRAVLMATEGFDVVAEAGDGSAALALATSHAPDVVILDITMPERSGLEVTTELRRTVPSSRILILSMHDHPQYVVEAVRAGAHGYIRKDAGPLELRNAVRAVHAGQGFFSPGLANRLSEGLQHEREQERQAQMLASLTTRERDVLLRIARGRTTRQIATEFHISPRTVESHRQSLMRKLEIRTVAGLTRLAMERGLLHPTSQPPAPAPHPPSPQVSHDPDRR
jgi:DNA-binding NarL/FixJ family response regulator